MLHWLSYSTPKNGARNKFDGVGDLDMGGRHFDVGGKHLDVGGRQPAEVKRPGNRLVVGWLDRLQRSVLVDGCLFSCCWWLVGWLIGGCLVDGCCWLVSGCLVDGWLVGCWLLVVGGWLVGPPSI